MYEILPDLWMCKNKDLNKIQSNIYTIKCNEQLSFLGRFKNYNNEIKNNILKYEILQLYKFTINTISKINELLLDNKNVIVCCNTNLQLSPLIIIAYIIKYGKFSKLEAILFFKTKKLELIQDELFFDNILNKISSEFK